METIFKVGMEVYDSLNFPDMKGVVKNIEKDCMGFWFVDVKFDKFVQSYTLQGSLSASNRPTLSTKPYKAILEDFEQKAPAPTLDEAIRWLKDNDLDTVLVEDSKATYFTKKENYFAFDALRRLIIFRDYYNQGWQPNWCDYKQTKYIIENYMDEIWTEDGHRTSSILAFKTPEIRDKFLEEQRELLEIAKPLL